MGIDDRKPVFGVCKQQRRRPSAQADQCIYYHSCLDSIISKLTTGEISVAEETGLSLALLETPKTGFDASRFMCGKFNSLRLKCDYEYEGYSKRFAYFHLETSNFKLAQRCSFHAIKELPVARNAKLQPIYPLPEGVTVR